jgi:large conductance mechanosensitive channel
VSDTNEKPSGVLSGFRAFMMRGNVIDLAVAVVIGAAFTAVVNSVVKGVINPVVGALGTQDLSEYRSCLKSCGPNAAGHLTGVYIQWGAVLGAALNFLITGAVVYFLMVLPMSRFLARHAARQHKEAQEQAATDSAEVALLREIRDELVRQRGGVAS